jgi:beta-lactam-binding protein with PASTA domain
VFAFPSTDYVITAVNKAAGRRITVQHVPAIARDVPFSDGTDTLLNIEQLRFADGVILNVAAAGGAISVAVPPVVGLTQAAAVAALTGADFVAASVNGNSTTAAVGAVILQSPTAGTLRPFGSTVTVTVTVGTVVPNVVNQSLATATTNITNAGLIVGAVTAINSAAAVNTILSQAPAGGTTTAPGTSVSLVRSLGPANVIVPNVINGPLEAAALTTLTNAGLTIGTRTTASSATVGAGKIISTNPAAGASVAPGTAVAYVVSTGPAAPLGLVAAFGFEEAAGTTVINSANGAFNGAIFQALRTATGKIGKALSFDGVNDWVTVTRRRSDRVSSSRASSTKSGSTTAHCRPRKS